MNRDSRSPDQSQPTQRAAPAFGWTVSETFSRLLNELAGALVRSDESRRDSPVEDQVVPRRIRTFQGVYVISVAARIVEMHPNTLRKYDREGLVSPSRSEGHQRLYSDTDVRRLQVVRTLAEKYNLNIDGVKLVLDLVQLMSGVADLLDSSPDVSSTRTARAASSELRRVLRELGAE